MSREIKFRAWVISSDAVGILDKPYMTNDNRAILLWLYEGTVGMKLMQYTGLKDKNGKEVFEGDIVMVGEYLNDRINENEAITDATKHEVKYFGDDGYPAFDLRPYVTDDTNSLSYVSENCDGVEMIIIGNIYQNGDLLK